MFGYTYVCIMWGVSKTVNIYKQKWIWAMICIAGFSLYLERERQTDKESESDRESERDSDSERDKEIE